ncbi:MAG: peptide chain release factor-like protein [Nitrospiraceae bacterium]|nr:MAG: peptide chain release factor-like protein [Nitrospiraceae bacterium]
MERLGIFEKDIEETFVRSGGKGGQNVNKVATCVQLRHSATCTEVKCQKARTQGLNRYYARVMLCDKIERQILGRESDEQKRIARLRRQKRRRSKRAREKMLADKHMQSRKKEERSFRISPEE